MLIRADLCVTLKVPEGTVIEDGSIVLPDGHRLEPEAFVTENASDGYPVRNYSPAHVYYTTPVEVSELYEGGDRR